MRRRRTRSQFPVLRRREGPCPIRRRPARRRHPRGGPRRPAATPARRSTRLPRRRGRARTCSRDPRRSKRVRGRTGRCRRKRGSRPRRARRRSEHARRATLASAVAGRRRASFGNAGACPRPRGEVALRDPRIASIDVGLHGASAHFGGDCATGVPKGRLDPSRPRGAAKADRPAASPQGGRVSCPAAGRYPSGQREQTVNLSAQPSKVRILPGPPARRRAPSISTAKPGTAPVSRGSAVAGAAAHAPRFAKRACIGERCRLLRWAEFGHLELRRRSQGSSPSRAKRWPTNPTRGSEPGVTRAPPVCLLHALSRAGRRSR